MKTQNSEICVVWLKKKLTGGFALCDDVREAGRQQGYARGQLTAARKVLGVETFHQFDEDGATQNWFWSLPTVPHKDLGRRL